MQEDPFGLAGGLNLYGYAAGDPVNFSDPFGLCPDPAKPWCSSGTYAALRYFGASDATAERWAEIGYRAAMTAGAPGSGMAVRGLAGAATQGRGATAGRVQRNLTPKIQRQMSSRAWSATDIDETLNSPVATRAATNKATGNPATAYFRKDGSYVVRDNRTGDIVQVSDRTDPSWVPDRTIQDPYRP